VQRHASGGKQNYKSVNLNFLLRSVNPSAPNNLVTFASFRIWRSFQAVKPEGTKFLSRKFRLIYNFCSAHQLQPRHEEHLRCRRALAVRLLVSAITNNLKHLYKCFFILSELIFILVKII